MTNADEQPPGGSSQPIRFWRGGDHRFAVRKESKVCRWVAYLGAPIAPKELLHDPPRSLIEQSRRHAPNMAIPNGDGTGLAWYDRRAEPALFRSITPAWGDDNLLELATEIRSPIFLAHVRAGTGTPVQQSNCHPFRYRNWLFVHNGYVADYAKMRRELLLGVHPDLFPNIEGSTDSELMFYLALTFGLADEPIAALARMAGFIEATAAAADVADPALQMTVGISDGKQLYAARYASGTEVNTLFVNEDVASVRMLYPEDERLAHFTEGARVVVSEPLVHLPGFWREIPTGTAIIVGDEIEERPFEPARAAA
jgi:predicted glutamine amidotransferase